MKYPRLFFNWHIFLGAILIIPFTSTSALASLRQAVGGEFEYKNMMIARCHNLGEKGDGLVLAKSIVDKSELTRTRKAGDRGPEYPAWKITADNVKPSEKLKNAEQYEELVRLCEDISQSTVAELNGWHLIQSPKKGNRFLYRSVELHEGLRWYYNPRKQTFSYEIENQAEVNKLEKQHKESLLRGQKSKDAKNQWTAAEMEKVSWKMGEWLNKGSHADAHRIAKQARIRGAQVATYPWPQANLEIMGGPMETVEGSKGIYTSLKKMEKAYAAVCQDRLVVPLGELIGVYNGAIKKHDPEYSLEDSPANEWFLLCDKRGIQMKSQINLGVSLHDIANGFKGKTNMQHLLGALDRAIDEARTILAGLKHQEAKLPPEAHEAVVAFTSIVVQNTWCYMGKGSNKSYKGAWCDKNKIDPAPKVNLGLLRDLINREYDGVLSKTIFHSKNWPDFAQGLVTQVGGAFRSFRSPKAPDEWAKLLAVLPKGTGEQTRDLTHEDSVALKPELCANGISVVLEARSPTQAEPFSPMAKSVKEIESAYGKLFEEIHGK